MAYLYSEKSFFKKYSPVIYILFWLSLVLFANYAFALTSFDIPNTGIIGDGRDTSSTAICALISMF